MGKYLVKTSRNFVDFDVITESEVKETGGDVEALLNNGWYEVTKDDGCYADGDIYQFCKIYRRNMTPEEISPEYDDLCGTLSLYGINLEITDGAITSNILAQILPIIITEMIENI